MATFKIRWTMATFKIRSGDLSANPFVSAAEDALAYWDNPYPTVDYTYDGNEVCIDSDWYTLQPDVQKYLENIGQQIKDKPIGEVDFETKTIEIIDARYRDDNEELCACDEDYEHNGLIIFCDD